MEHRKKIIFDDTVEGNTYVVVYNTGYQENDDSFEDTNTIEIELKAPDFDTALRYAQQYLRKMKTDDKTSEMWQTAEIISIEQY